MPPSPDRLPPGMTCQDCCSRSRCRFVLGPSFSPTSTRCDWSPSRFIQGLRSTTTKGVAPPVTQEPEQLVPAPQPQPLATINPTRSLF